jgi:hypothetical protein
MPPPTSTAAPSPTPPPARTSIDLGVPAGDTYSVLSGALDAERGLLYALAADGDARQSGGVIAVVDLSAGTVRATAPLPAMPGWPTVSALSADGSRLYFAGTGAEYADNVIVIATGAGSRPLGEVLGTVLDARALALDAEGGFLYVANDRVLRMLDAFTLKEREIVNLRPGMSPTVMLAVNRQANRVYVSASGDNIINTYRADDLTPIATIEPGAQVYGLAARAGDPHTYALTQAFTRPVMVSRAAVIEGDAIIRQWDAGEDFTVGRVAWDEQGRVMLLEDGRQAGVQQTRIRVMDASTGDTLRTLRLPYSANLQYASAAVVYRGALHRLGDTVYPIALDTGEMGLPLPLGIHLMQIALDEAAGRLFVLDSTGTVQVVSVPAMERVAAWPVIEAGPDRPYWGQMSLHGGRLCIADHVRGVTVVLDAADGSRIGEIPKAGQVSADSAGSRLFVTDQGVHIADGVTYEIVGAIDATVRKDNVFYSPGATEALYDPGSGLLFVTMTNNGTGSGARTWLDVYDGKTLALADSPITSDQRFVDGLLVDAGAGRVWVASNYPQATLSAWALDGRLLLRLRGLAGRLYLDAARNRLYVRAWGGLAAADAQSGDVVGFTPLEVQYPDTAALDTRSRKFYLTSNNSATVWAVEPDVAAVSAGSPGALPSRPVRRIAVGADDSMLAVAYVDDVNAGLFRSEAGGWVRVRGALPGGLLDVIAAPGKPNTFFAFQSEYYTPLGLYRSTDGGRTWAPSLQGVTDFYIRGLALSPNFATDGTALLLTGYTGIFRTTDGGGTWRLFSDIAAERAAASGELSFMVLASDSRYTSTLVYVSRGESGPLEQVGLIPMYSYAFKALALSPNFAEDGVALVATENAGMFRTEDGGRTWNPVGPTIGSYIPQFAFLFAPDYAASRTVYALGTESLDGGREERRMLRSTDGGKTWQRATDLPVEIACAAVGPDGQFWMGTTDGRVEPLDLSRLRWESAPAPTPTFTPPPPPTPVPTATPIVFDQPPVGLYWPHPVFDGAWRANESLRQSLGWAADWEPHDTAAATQAFEGGVMIWRQEVGEVYVLFPPGDWYAFTGTWAEGQTESDPSIVPPPGRYQPVRGFGKVWRSEGWVRERLGWAVETERGATAQAQRFEHGWMLRLEGSIYALVSSDIGPAYWQRHEGR